MIIGPVIALALMAEPVPSPTGCDVIVELSGGGLDMVQVPGLAEALATADQPLPVLPAKAQAISCWRETLEPGPYDDRAISEGKVPELFMSEPSGRTAKLARERGRFVYTFAMDRAPDPEPELAAVVNERLNAFDARWGKRKR